MGAKKREVIGDKFTSTTGDNFTIVKELEKRACGQRQFVIQCDKCNTEKNTSYTNIYQIKKIRCVGCMPEIKNDVEEVKLKRQPKVSKDYIGKTLKMKFDEFYVVEELPRTLSNKGHIYRNFLVRCTNCGTERQTLAASLNSGGVACRTCMTKERNIKLDLWQPPIDIERKIEIMSEINQIWDDMKRMAKKGELTKYLVKKFEINERLLDEEEHTERIDVVVDNDDVNYDDVDVDWDAEINRLIDDE